MSDEQTERFLVTNVDPGWKDPAWTYHGEEDRPVEGIFLWFPDPKETCRAGLKTFRVTLISETAVVRCIAIANVFTHPEHRNRGYATGLLTRTVEYLMTNGELVAILFSRERKLYQSVGFQKIGEAEGEWIYAKSLNPLIKLAESERWLIV